MARYQLAAIVLRVAVVAISVAVEATFESTTEGLSESELLPTVRPLRRLSGLRRISGLGQRSVAGHIGHRARRR
jgi:hypothetical protein